MKKLIFIFALFFSGLSCAADENTLFFLTAHQGSLTQLSKNNYILSFKTSPEYVSYFTDRPMKKSGVITTHDFLSLWKNSKNKKNLAIKPLNASVVLVNESGRRQNFVAVILNPGYVDGRLSYQISVLDKKPIIAGSLKHIALYFNNIHWNPSGV